MNEVNENSKYEINITKLTSIRSYLFIENKIRMY